MTSEEADALAAGIAEMDSRLVGVVYQAMREKALVAKDYILAGHPDELAEHVARSVWAWLAQGDE